MRTAPQAGPAAREASGLEAPTQRRAPRRPAGLAARWLGAVIVAAAALVSYSNATPAVAIHDDAFFVPARHSLSWESAARIFSEDMWSATGSPAGVYRPLVVLSIAANGAMFGQDPSGYHAANVVLHLVASLMVYLLMLELVGRVARREVVRTAGGAAARPAGPVRSLPLSAVGWIAAIAAAVFAVHPVHTEAVDSVYNRSDIMATTFVAAALVVLHRFHERHVAAAWAATAVLYFLALLCRESAVSLPALAALLVWFSHPDESLRQRMRRVLPAAVLLVPLAEYFVLRSHALATTVQTTAPVLGVDAGQDLASRALYSIAAIREYLRMMVWPHPLRVSYENFTGDGVAASLAVHASLAGAAFAMRRRAPLASWAIVAFYVALIPSTRIFTSSGAEVKIGDFVLLRPQGGLVLVGERVGYLPSMAFTAALAVGAWHAAARFGLRAVAAVAAVVVAAGIVVTRDRNEAWHAADELFAREVEATPDNGDAWRLYVSALQSAGRIDEAAKVCDGQLEQPNRSAQLFNNCGVVYDKLGRDEQAIRAYSRTIEMGLTAVGHANLGRVYARIGRMAEAEAEFAAAVEAETNPAQKHYRRGQLLVRFHPEKRAEARREFEQALRLRPDYAAAKQALAGLPR